MAEKFIFHMYGVNKFYGQRQALKDINLSFYPGAKIGIVGENGSGKTTVLRIMAGHDTEFQGRAQITPGFPAEQAGLEEEDVILAVDGIEINSVEELVKTIRSQEVGQEIEITYWRGNSENTTRATLVEMPEL